MSADSRPETRTATPHAVPRWALFALAGLGGVLLLGGALGWLLRGSAILIDMADFFCL